MQRSVLSCKCKLATSKCQKSCCRKTNRRTPRHIMHEYTAYAPGLFTAHDPTRGSSQEGFKPSLVGRVGSGGVRHVRSGRVRSGRVKRFSNVTGRVGSRSFQISRVGSGRVMKCSKFHRSGRVMTREIRVTHGSGQRDPRVVFG